MSSVADLVANVLNEAGFDATEDQAVQALSRRHELMCSRSKCYRERIEVGPTVAGQGGYAVPARVVEIREIQVSKIPYGTGRHRDIAEGALNYLWLNGVYVAAGGGIAQHDYDEGGNALINLFPVPTEAGESVTVYAVCRPEPLTLTGTAGVVVGNPVTFRFCFTNRVLTDAERTAFVATGVLPAGVGVDPTSVTFEYQAPGAAYVTLSGASIVKDGIGAYHTVLTVNKVGMWLWRGRGFDVALKETAATPLEETQVNAGGSPLKVPPEFYDALVNGAIATLMMRVESRADLAAPFEAAFTAACGELLRQSNKRFRGIGPSQIRVAGVNA